MSRSISDVRVVEVETNVYTVCWLEEGEPCSEQISGRLAAALTRGGNGSIPGIERAADSAAEEQP